MSATSPTSLQSTRKAWLALAVLILGVVMGMLDTTIVNVALPTIRTSLDASESVLSWIISGYALAYGLILIPAGRIGDRIGHKWVFLVGLTGFTVASLACGLAQDGTALVVARVAQGLFGGLFFPPVTALIQLMFPGRARGKAFAVMGASIGVSTALGPIVGGLLIEWLGEAEGWRSIFFVNLPFGVIAVIAALIVLPGGAEGADAKGADWFGFLLLGGALVAILVPLIEGQDQDWPLWTWLSLAGGVVLLVLFALWELALARRGRTSPLVPPHLFSHPAFSGGVVLALVYFAAFTSIFFTISILWQSGLGHTALESGLVSIPFALGSIVGAAFSDRLAHHLGRRALVIGTALVALGLIAVWLVLLLVPAADLTNWELLAPLAVAGVGSGIFIAPNAQFIVATVDRTEAGAASGVIGTMQRIGSAIGIAVIGSVFFGTLEISGPADVAPAFASSAAHAMLVSAAFAVAAFALVFVLPKRVDRGYQTIPSE
ncbi:MFS transporter [Protaetiibacter intestinalis]|uniref:MFS transporter n=1 Tax=Protaetiibacter intestinalis TaxID=2419774 RepID=A0A387BJP9_9MICO|nr:MFS transporter [Protaetiibacter intestinalis]AYF98750.1 MFS transporter [Protaetiibacter intestinalis]